MQQVTGPHQKLRIELQAFKALKEAIELGSEEAALQNVLDLQEALHGVSTRSPSRSPRGYQDQRKLLSQSLCSMRVKDAAPGMRTQWLCSSWTAQSRSLYGFPPNLYSYSALGQPKGPPGHSPVMHFGDLKSSHRSMSSSSSSHTAHMPLCHPRLLFTASIPHTLPSPQTNQISRLA